MASTDSVETRSSRPPRSSPAAGSSSSSSSGSVISARAICTRLRSPSLRVPKVRSASCAAPSSRSSSVARSWSRSSYSSRQRPTTPYDAETTTSCTRSPRGIRSPSDALVRPIRGRSSKTSTVPSTSSRMPGDARGRVDLGRGDLQQRGLAGAVGPEDHPALVLLDRPVDRVEQHRLASPDGHAGELEDGGHGASPYALARPPRRSVPDVPSALPASVRLAWWGTAWLRGHVVADELIDAVVDDDATHLLGGHGAPPDALVAGLGALRARGADAIGAALPAEGDLVGLGGPGAFNAPPSRPARPSWSSTRRRSSSRAWCPTGSGRRSPGVRSPAERRQLPDVGEADRDAADRPAGGGRDAGPARRRPLAARGRGPADEPAAPARRRRTARGARALRRPGRPRRCRPSRSSSSRSRTTAARSRRTTPRPAARRIAPLGRAGRRALVAAASPEVWPPARRSAGQLVDPEHVAVGVGEEEPPAAGELVGLLGDRAPGCP